jgi:hypothetical protein
MDIEYRRRDRHIKINQLIVQLVYMEGGRPAPGMYVAVVVVVVIQCVSPPFLTTVWLPFSDGVPVNQLEQGDSKLGDVLMIRPNNSLFSAHESVESICVSERQKDCKVFGRFMRGPQLASGHKQSRFG